MNAAAPQSVAVNGAELRLLSLLGHGKGGYSYLVEIFRGKADFIRPIHREWV